MYSTFLTVILLLEYLEHAAINISSEGSGSQRAGEVTSHNESRAAGWQKLSLEELLTWIILMNWGAAEVATLYEISAFSLETSICVTLL